MWRPNAIATLAPQGVANALLSLGTLVDWDEQLAAAVDQPLAAALLQHAVAVVGGPGGCEPFKQREAGWGGGADSGAGPSCTE